MDCIKINGEEIYQPDSGLAYNFETTYTSDSARVQTGVGHFTPLFTVEQLGYKASNVPVDEAVRIIQAVIKGLPFTLHYFSMYYGEWRDGSFYVGQGNLAIGELSDDQQILDSLSFNMTGIDPI